MVPLVKSRSGGFSLIEFMVAMVLGIVIIGGAVSVYLASKRSYTEVEQVAALSENGRFALEMLIDSMRQIGMLGETAAADITTDSLGAVTDDCTGNAATARPAEFLSAARVPDPSVAMFGCIPDAVANTDILIIKNVEPRPLYDINPNDPNDPDNVRDGVFSYPAPAGLSGEEVYLVGNQNKGVLFDGADTPPGILEGGEVPLGVAWPYRVQIYYVRNLAVPTLSRKILRWNGSAMAMETEDLVPGVELLQFRFGMDSGGDGETDSYTNLSGSPSIAWNTVDAIEVYMLLRSQREDINYTDSKIYQLAGESVGPKNDHFRRLLLQSSVSLRNPQLYIRGGLQ